LGISSEIKNQVDQLESKFEEATQLLKDDMNQIEKNMSGNIQAAVTQAFETALTKSEQTFTNMQQSIIDTERQATKLTGDIKIANETIDQLQSKAATIANQTTQQTDKAIKDYIKAKSDLQISVSNSYTEIQNHQDDAIKNIKSYAETVNTTKEPVTTSSDNGKYYKSYPDEYMINGKVNSIRVKKFQEDKTKLQCNSNDELTMMYNLFVQVATQYGIYITPAIQLEKWDMKYSHIPSTFPLSSSSFESDEQFNKAYTTMSLAIATKLKESVNFDESYMAAHMAVNSYNNDGYIMLYHLMKNVHPRLQRNKATKPKKPIFTGDINAFILKFKNWLAYQEQREKPHVYDDDEIADDIIAAIKTSNWAASLKKGLDIVETKLDRWKNSDDTVLPDDLTIDFIGHTLMTPYVENNENPLSNSRRSDNNRERDRPTIRSAYQRGRSRSNPRYSRSRSTSRPRSQSKEKPTRDCTICGERHLETTVGCPHLYRHMNIQDYVRNNNRRSVENQVREIQQDRRERSRSRTSSRSSRSQQQD
jgi:hypothetical protein